MAIKKVGVVGCGLMGSGIAQVCAAAGFETVVREVAPEVGDGHPPPRDDRADPGQQHEDQRERNDERPERGRSDRHIRAGEGVRDQREERDPEDHEHHPDQYEVLEQEHRLARDQRFEPRV